MTLYVAFLRGINVGGRNLLKMQQVRERFSSLGFGNVSSYKASGNILFETDVKPDDAVKKVKGELLERTGRNLAVFLRTSIQIQGIIEFDPFKGREADSNKLYITFIPHKPKEEVKLPLWSRNNDVEIILVRSSEVFSQTFLYKGRFGAPNKFVENEFKVPATTRNWNTIRGIHEKIIQDYS
ncbi:MAG: DUF1697 domain-containing protein [Candidatus Thorarchaeota archaeon]|jgi:uncharacterized protein (DUF1697 family)